MGIQNLDYQPDRTGYDCMIYVKSLTSNSSNSALYVSSRTLFTLAQRSSSPRIRNTIGRTNNGHTPLAAITVSFLPGALAFLAVRAKEIAFQELIHVFGRLYTGPMLCVYAAQCLSFLRFLSAIKFYSRTLSRDSVFYRQKHYRAHWQPLWAILGLVLCSLLMFFSGWAAIYDLVAKSENVNRADSIVDLIAAYLGPFFFFTILISYKLLFGTRIRSTDDMRNAWFVRDASEKEKEENGTAHTTSRNRKVVPRNRFYEFLSWVR
ncbi:MAG: hypothetical protein L6R42_010584 [Xanthoria sp. 1 TBL-2021]|nr:MAG: hypothetical protein L6R42_010584 [Xanthoria sp. 1 TBL-2021]